MVPETPRRSTRLRQGETGDVPATPSSAARKRKTASVKTQPREASPLLATPASTTKGGGASPSPTKKKALRSPTVAADARWRAPHWAWLAIAQAFFYFFTWCFLVWLPIMHIWSVTLLFFAWSAYQTYKAARDPRMARTGSQKGRLLLFGVQCALVVLTTFLKYRFTFQHYTGVRITTLGEVTATSARLFARFPVEGAALQLQMRELAAGKKESTWATTSHRFEAAPAADFVGHAHVKDLKPNTRYAYRWVNATDGAPLLPLPTQAVENTFKTQDPAATSLRFVFGTFVL